ncbi:MAG: hypothetical protein JNL51_14275 [Chitinophagaceae bacterium]|nr:hypothetical protein [Chitinophagaceae bacterium]
MDALFPDQRKAITGEFFVNDSRLRHTSRKAYKKIAGWKASIREPANGDSHFREQYDNLLRNSFFNAVSNSYILQRENFSERPLHN